MKENLSRMWRSGLALLLALVLVVGMCPVTAFAAEGEISTAELESALKDMLATVEKYAPSVAGRLYDYAVDRGYVDAVKDTYAEMKAEVDAAKEAFETEDAPAIENAIALLNEQIALLKEQIAELKDIEGIADIEEQIAELENAAADLLAALNSSREAMAALDNAAVVLGNTIDNLLNVMANPSKDSAEDVAAALAAAKADVQSALVNVIAGVDELPTTLGILADLTIAVGADASNLVDFIVADLQTIFDNLQAENNNEYDSQISAAIEKFEAAKAAIEAELSAQINELKDEYAQFIEEDNAEQEAELNAKIEAAEAAAKEKTEALIAAHEDELKELKAKAEAELDKTDKDEAAVAAAKEKVAELKETVKNEVGPTIDSAAEALTAAKITAKEAVATTKALINKLEDAIKKLVYDATHDNVNKNQYSYYVAMGDEAANTELGYVDIVAGRIGDGFDYNKYFAEYGENIAESYALVEANKDAIAAADLITIDFSSNVFMKAAVKQITSNTHPNWALYVGETGEDVVLESLAIVEKLLKEAGVEQTALLMNFIEGYAYSYVTYVFNMPFVVNAIREYNADAAVVLVGMHNSMDGVSLTIGGKNLPLGGCVQILVDAANVYATGYCMLTGNATYVHAPDVEVYGADEAYDVLSFANYLMNVEDAFLPTNNGHIYIADKILEALNVKWVDDEAPIYRLAGNNRYLTAIEVAYDLLDELNVPKFQNIIIASGLKFPDSLSGAYLASVVDAPILMADPEVHGNYYAAVLGFVDEFLAENGTVYILGGTATIPASVENDMLSYTDNVVRLGGKNRYATCLEILEEAAKHDPAAATTEVLVCSGVGDEAEGKWSDSLAASAVGKPILLVNGNGALNAEQNAYLTGKDAVIIGGTSTVTADVEAQVAAVSNVKTRLAGSNRVLTSIAIANYYFDGNDDIVLTDGRKFADSLSGGPLANAKNAPIILGMPESAWSMTNASGYVAENAIAKGAIVGGPASVSDETARTIFGLADDYYIPVK